MEKLKEFFKKSIVYILFCLFSAMIIILYIKGEQSEKENEELEKERNISERKAKIYLDKNNALVPKIDSLVNENSKLLIELINIAKKEHNVTTKYYEKIKVINKFAVSDMQSYFISNFGTGESSNPR